MLKGIIVLITLYIAFISTDAYSQIFFTGKPETVNFYSFPYFKSWNLKEKDQKVSQFSIPFFVQILPKENLSIWLNDSVADSSIKMNDETSSLSGISDLKTKISYSMLDRRLLATLGIGFPIGVSRLDQEQVGVANVIYDEVLGFSVNKLGGGFEINPGVVFAIDSGVLGASISTSYLMKSSYKSIKDSDSDYDPGDEINTILSLDLVQEPLSLYGDMAYTIYTNDKTDDNAVFKQGDEIKGRLFIVYKSEPIIIAFSFADTIRMKDKIIGENGKLVTEEQNSHGNKIDVNLNNQFYFNRNFSLISSAGVTFIADNGYEKNGAFILDLGTGIQFSPNRKTSFIFNGKILNGNMKSGDLNISGFEIGTVAIIRF